jgi:malonyl CoA-acyl carrier protein transacylase
MEGATALLFPGQGSQSADMRERVERHRPDLLALAIEEVGNDPFERVDEGTGYAQPAIYCASLAGWTELGEPEVDWLAGHSLGELGALVAAGSITAEDGLRLVALRGRAMQRGAEAQPGGGMLAIRAPVERAAAVAERTGLTLANDNAPEQVVLTGPAEALDRAVELAAEEGLMAKRLSVAGAFHHPAMEEAARELAAALDEVEISPPRTPVVSGVTAEPFDDVRRRLAESVVRPVRWREALLALHGRGVRRFVEVGPGKVLTGLVRRTLTGVDAHTVTSLEGAHA